MITPLSYRPLHAIRYRADILKDTITALFFATLSAFNEKWFAYAEYYAAIANAKMNAVKIDHEHLIQTTANTPHPKKVREIPAPPPFKKDYLTFRDKIKPQGYCLGMCNDFIRRVKNSKKPFYETVVEVANKFANGATKKAFIYQHQFGQIFIKESYFDSCEKKLNERIKQDQTMVLRELVRKIRCKIENALDLGYKVKVFKHDFMPENHASLPNGDYIISIGKNEGYGHAICLFKREEGSVLFDPNTGAYFFQDPVKLYECVQKAGAAVFQGETIVELSICI